ncbi:hypothetical protein FOZ62_031849 [Perkinsus olseni]|uniref:N-acetyltransferase domain-containing protein n=1 Tax=Perkinsus olseni TaxID=32597 RepID=A0A7J6S4W0_PEROL|nr:hypothetical protein FOZ62_031849 [Perkinsus olseni]
MLAAFKVTILALQIPSVHTAIGGAAARVPPRDPGSPLEEGTDSGFLPELEYRPWRPGDLFAGEPLPITYGRRFVAVLPNSETVAGYVESEEDKPPPAYLEDELPEMTERDTVVYISFVIVHSYVQNKRVASTMLPKALDDIRVRWPTAIAAHLVADRTQTAATKLYNRLNFTVVHRSRQSLFLLYKYPPHNASQ